MFLVVVVVAVVLFRHIGANLWCFFLYSHFDIGFCQTMHIELECISEPKTETTRRIYW